VKVGRTVNISLALDRDPLLTQWDSATPFCIGTPLRMGTPPFCQEFDELAEVPGRCVCFALFSCLWIFLFFYCLRRRYIGQIEARYIVPLIARKNEVGRPVVAIAACSMFTLEQVMTHKKYQKMTAAEVVLYVQKCSESQPLTFASGSVCFSKTGNGHTIVLPGLLFSGAVVCLLAVA
jgi:hypothetical protein